MIEISQLSFRYREGADPILKGIDLSIPDGAFVGVTGAAGSGKSTLTYAINGIIPHCYPGDFYGSVRVDGVDTCEASLTDISRLVGSVCQDIDSQMVSSVVEDEVLYGLENFGVPKAEIPARVDEALAAMGITDLRDRSIAELLEIGVNCPRSTSLVNRLRARELVCGPAVCTVEGAVCACEGLLSGKGACA